MRTGYFGGGHCLSSLTVRLVDRKTYLWAFVIIMELGMPVFSVCVQVTWFFFIIRLDLCVSGPTGAVLSWFLKGLIR